MKPFPDSLDTTNSCLGQLDQTRMKARLPKRGGKHGVALIMVLFCVVLIATLVVAFLLVSLSQRRVAASLASTTQVDLFSQSAANTILADLKQEIAAGSTLSGNVYVPNSLSSYVANYASAVPDFALPFKNISQVPIKATNTGGTDAAGGFAPFSSPVGASMWAETPPTGCATYLFPNLLKMSAYNIPFYGGNTTGNALGTQATASCYSTTRPSRASASFTTTASLNGRYISLADWNKPYFLPVTSSSDDTPLGLTKANAPQWIMVPNDGTTQTTFSSALQKGGGHPVIGRYAYMIYNEGGDLDVNALSNPYNSNYNTFVVQKSGTADGGTGPASYPSSFIPPYHMASLSAVDLPTFVNYILGNASGANGAIPSLTSTTPIPSGDEKTLLTLPAWRNNASQANYTPNTNGAFWNAMILNNYTGFLKPWSLNTGTATQTDQIFTSRQALIQYLAQTNGGSLTQGLKDSLNYFTTFSRALNRPSLIHPGTPLSTATLPTPTTDTNPTFSNVTVSTAFTRFNGSQAIPGEPLVLKRFPLSRLTWLTYAGPSAARGTDLLTAVGTAPNIASPSSNTDLELLMSSFGIPYSYLQQGTAQRIYDAFGLSWVPDASGSGASEWCYDHSGTTPLTSMTSKPLSINTLAYVAANTTREPDFIELLKAAILNGALGKQVFDQLYTLSAGADCKAMDYQNAVDSNTDIAILQIAANIIAQSSCDGYPPRIAYVAPSPIGYLYSWGPYSASGQTYSIATTSLGGTGGVIPVNSATPVEEVYGSKNMASFISLQECSLQVVPPTNTTATVSNGASPSYTIPANQTLDAVHGYYDIYQPAPTPPATTPPASAPDLTCSGLLVLLMQPQMWNPYDPNCPLGAPRPTQYQFGIDATDPDNVILGNTLGNTTTPKSGTYRLWGVYGYSANGGSVGSGNIVPATPNGNTYTVTGLQSYNAINPPGVNLYMYNAATGANNYTLSKTFTETLQTSALQFVDPPGGVQTLGYASRYSEPTLLAITGFPAGLKPASTSYLSGGGATIDPTDFPSVVTWANSFPVSPNTMPSSLSSTKFVVPPNSYWDTANGGFKSFSNYTSGADAMLFYNNPSATPYSQILSGGTEVTGILIGWSPIAWLHLGTYVSGSGTPKTAYFDLMPEDLQVSAQVAGTLTTSAPGAPPTSGPDTKQSLYGALCLTCRTQYADASGVYHTFDQKLAAPGFGGNTFSSTGDAMGTIGNHESRYGFDPRTPRWGVWLFERGGYSGPWVDPAYNVTGTYAPNRATTFGATTEDNSNGTNFSGQTAAGWFAPVQASPSQSFAVASLAQNDAQQNPISNTAAGASQYYYSDPDGIVRRASGGYASRCFGAIGSATLTGATALSTDGDVYAAPLISTSPTSYANGNTTATGYSNVRSTQQSNSRPYILNRPFRSVAELGYVFSGTPWKNLDMSTPESGYAGLLEAFCINESDNDQGLEAGKVDLNTRQLPVLQAILAGAYADDFNAFKNSNLNLANGNANSSSNAIPIPYVMLSASHVYGANTMAQLLINRTADFADIGQGPLTCLSDLVGKYVSSNNGNTTTTSGPWGGTDGTAFYSGFSGDLSAITDTQNEINQGVSNKYMMVNNVPRFREAPIRALSAVGQTRVWNLMIDLIAQTGEFPTTATTADQFVVNAQHRYWLHVAIDRQSGQVLDEYVEPVTQ